MKRNLNEAIGSLVHAKDGNIGRIIDFLFDDHKWTIRYLVVETVGWQAWHKVLLSPHAILKHDWESREITVNLTKEQVRNSPDMHTAKTVSREYEAELHHYYSWPLYWGTAGLYGVGVPLTDYVPASLIRMNESGERISSYKPKGDPNLRSILETTGYKALADNKDIGQVESFFADDETWVISYMLIDSMKLMPGKKILISPHWISDVSWFDSEVYIDLTVRAIKDCPEFDYLTAINPDYETKICDYYSSAQE